MHICFVCGKEVKDYDEFEWHGYDGDKIHKRCKPNLSKAYNTIDNMSEADFQEWLSGKRELME